MINELLESIFGVYETPLADLDARHALAAVLVRLAKADAHYHVAEIGQIDRILQATYGLGRVEAAKLRAEAEKLEATAPADGRFAEAVRARTDPAERRALFTAMWQVLLSDGQEANEQREYLAATAERFGISDADQAASEAEARAGQAPGPAADPKAV